ncbi:MAG: putative selenium-dependent hydroxylase accessory protein YqeC [Anaerolineae bacterium]|nr:putative selenium-dependent hydroxylase accessory protein YqeC [Anaerolineae bacterium]
MNLSHALRITVGDVVAFVGGGGKTTAMFQLAHELAPQMRVLTTTTTRIFAAQIKRSPAHVTFDPAQQSLAAILPLLNGAIARHGQVLLIGQADPASGKAFGLSPEIIDTLAASGHFDVILNEADGSRMRPLKAPAAHEPVIPAATTLVVPVVGLDVLGQPLGDDTVHRAGLVSRLSGTALGQAVTTGTVTALLCHPDGGLKHIPAQARVAPLLNKVDMSRSEASPDAERVSAGEEGWKMAHPREALGSREPLAQRLAAAREIAGGLLACERVDSVVIGAVQQAVSPVVEVHSRVAAVILAAGGSTRFGSPKQLVRWGDKTFIEQVVDSALASEASPVVVVLGAEVEQSRALLRSRPVEIVLNPAWVEGQSVSMQAGLAVLPAHAGGVLFLLVDLPGVTPALLDELIQRHRETLAPLIWPEFEGQRGNPVLFDRALFPELRQISGDMGGRPLLLKYKDQAERVQVAEAGILQDFDRPEDLAAFKARL